MQTVSAITCRSESKCPLTLAQGAISRSAASLCAILGQ